MAGGKHDMNVSHNVKAFSEFGAEHLLARQEIIALERLRSRKV